MTRIWRDQWASVCGPSRQVRADCDAKRPKVGAIGRGPGVLRQAGSGQHSCLGETHGYPSPTPAPDLAAVKTRQQGACSSGTMPSSAQLQIVGEQLCEALDIRAGQKVLDVAAATANVSLAAARRWCEVTSTTMCRPCSRVVAAAPRPKDYALTFQQADAESPWPFGRTRRFERSRLDVRRHVHAPRRRAAAEMARVCKSGGKIGMANWTRRASSASSSRPGQAPAAAGRRQVAGAVGTKARLRSCSRAGVGDRHRAARLRLPLPLGRALPDVFRTYYGPVLKAFAASRPVPRRHSSATSSPWSDNFNRSGDSTMVVPRLPRNRRRPALRCHPSGTAGTAPCGVVLRSVPGGRQDACRVNATRRSSHLGPDAIDQHRAIVP